MKRCNDARDEKLRLHNHLHGELRLFQEGDFRHRRPNVFIFRAADWISCLSPEMSLAYYFKTGKSTNQTGQTATEQRKPREGLILCVCARVCFMNTDLLSYDSTASWWGLCVSRFWQKKLNETIHETIRSTKQVTIRWPVTFATQKQLYTLRWNVGLSYVHTHSW